MNLHFTPEFYLLFTGFRLIDNLPGLLEIYLSNDYM
jgi:hypothetical protein